MPRYHQAQPTMCVRHDSSSMSCPVAASSDVRLVVPCTSGAVGWVKDLQSVAQFIGLSGCCIYRRNGCAAKRTSCSTLFHACKHVFKAEPCLKNMNSKVSADFATSESTNSSPASAATKPIAASR